MQQRAFDPSTRSHSLPTSRHAAASPRSSLALVKVVGLLDVRVGDEGDREGDRALDERRAPVDLHGCDDGSNLVQLI